MNRVRIVNLRNEKADFKCDRSTPLGNFNFINKGNNRDAVCNAYHRNFYDNLNPDNSPEGFLEYLDKILQEATKRPITIGCWCYPKRCHCDTIKSWLDTELFS